MQVCDHERLTKTENLLPKKDQKFVITQDFTRLHTLLTCMTIIGYTV